MLRLSKSTDYGIRILAHLAHDGESATHNAREVAEELGLPTPMVSKVISPGRLRMVLRRKSTASYGSNASACRSPGRPRSSTSRRGSG